ncbi:MAG: hypothetical protein V3W41_07845 [Planctomycetota bacterium]
MNREKLISDVKAALAKSIPNGRDFTVGVTVDPDDPNHKVIVVHGEIFGDSVLRNSQMVRRELRDLIEPEDQIVLLRKA